MLYIGIDPSINSTGLCINYNDVDNFYIICPKHKIKEQAQNLTYIFYDKDTTNTEIAKTHNLISIANAIEDVIQSYQDNERYIVIEGLSYGSTRTKALCDLAGLNYLIRERFINDHLTIITPSEAKKFATGKGNVHKEVIVELFKGIYPELMNIKKLDDIADAYFMSLYSRYINKEA